ncbi:RHS repeat-associated protein [Olsenella profusa DSM 13989]|uniref:RHS repeat-associated core domain-containing protein n=1 Tax=Olsenella profusa TaxID=138595 RepID=UPI002785C9B6|nr:RHS repeat-associated core domain-containing protein [Olsenella profusa]MDP9859182.1 RHS repeat-associated protein [Olsenella profusa DSM 13989]
MCDLLGQALRVCRGGAFGAALGSTPFGAPLASDPLVPLGAFGYVADPATGLLASPTRLYDPALGRFLSPDPVGGAPDRPHTLNRYAYAASNPTRYCDPTGGFINLLAGGVGAVVSGFFGAGIEMGKEMLIEGKSFDQLDGKKIAAKGVENAVIGGVAGLTCGASLGASIAANAGVGVLTDLADQTLVEGTARYNPPEAVVGHALVYGAWNGLSGATQYTTIGALANHVIAKEGVGLGLAKQLGLFSLYQLNSQPLIGGMMMLWERVTGYRTSACAGEEV